MAISEKKRLEVANICYANVANMFAMFCNPKFRGPNFRWGNFAEMMTNRAKDWIFIHGVRGNTTELNTLSEQYANEIASRLVAEAGFLDE